MDEHVTDKTKKKAEAKRKRAVASALRIVGAVVFVVAVFSFNLPSTVQQLVQPFINGVPQLGSAPEYYKAGLDFYWRGQPERTRECMKRAMKLGEGTPEKAKAELFIRTRLPAKPVSHEAEQANIEAYNASEKGNDAEAERIWLQLTRKDPDFEWAWTNLASLYISQGRPRAGEELVQHVLDRNPNFLNGWARMAEAKLARGQYEEAETYIAKGLEVDPQYYELLTLQQEARLARKRAERGNRPAPIR